MRLGLQIPWFTYPEGPAALGPTLRRIAREAEQAGVSSIFVMDHFFQISMMGPPEQDMLEGYTTLSHLAAVTERVRLGTLVTGVTYRHPGLLVKTVTTLDVLSGGRAWLGIGAAWNEEEHRGLGVTFPSTSERFERLEETLRIAKQMWAGDESAYEGGHYRLERPLNSPQALSKPHPPIMVGGSGEKKTLRLVAQYADACNLFSAGPDSIRHKLEVLRGHCADVGRDYDEITRTTLGHVNLSVDGSDGQSVQEATEQLAGLAELGIDEAIVNMPNVSQEGVFEQLAQVVAGVEPLVPAGR
ncbi:LLM class F420-dependent oxidoreductase [Angustibacter sp. McL0619]|uniref:LLM class F420-dependent oxidoreductase n=1 Tax=Angustibacter sp. McL0619 TaxID=3415676 RepID=UPI003CEA1AF4